MKVLLGVSLLVIMIILLLIGSYFLISKYAENIMVNLDDLDKASKDEDWLTASIIEKKLNKNWVKAKRILPMMIDHIELHDLEIFIARKSALIELKDKQRLLIEISAAKELIKNIQLQQKLSIRNIF